MTFNSDASRMESESFIGSEPSILSVARDGSAAYAYLSGEYSLARLNIAAGSRDLVFTADPAGGANQQYGVYDMTIGPDGGLAVSSQNAFVGRLGGFDQTRPGQYIGVFDNGILRPQIDTNSSGPFANLPATFELAFDDSGSRLYAYNSFLSSFELKVNEVSSRGVQWRSATGELVVGYGTKIRSAQGLLYASSGIVVDPEKLVRVGRFEDEWLGSDAVVAPDPSAGRVYFATCAGLLVFDSATYARLGRLPAGPGSIQGCPRDLVRVGGESLAYLTNAGRLYLVNIASIPR